MNVGKNDKGEAAFLKKSCVFEWVLLVKISVLESRIFGIGIAFVVSVQMSGMFDLVIRDEIL
jgi:hypothetical protein